MVDRRGPVRKSRFSVDLEIDGTEINGWQTVELPTITVNEATYRNGDEPSQERRLWGRTEYGDLTLERGVEPEGEMPITGDSLAGAALYNWHEEVRLGMVDAARKDVKVSVMNEQGEAIVGYLFHHAWPKEYDPPSLDATAAGDIAMESLTLSFHWFERADP